MLTKVLAISPGSSGLPWIISIRPTSIVNYIIAMILSMAVAVISTIVIAKVMNKKQAVENQELAA